MYHERHGEQVDELRVTMPVSIRKAGDPIGGQPHHAHAVQGARGHHRPG